MKLQFRILDSEQQVVAESADVNEVTLLVSRTYRTGDRIEFSISDAGSAKDAVIDNTGAFIHLQLDDAIGSECVWLSGDINYSIPFGEKRVNLSPKAFSGERHLLTARVAEPWEMMSTRNLARNIWDHPGNETCFPKASANVETRGESVFAARNAIDGVYANWSHGEWPFQSWGINRREDACLRVDFGRAVAIEQIALRTRADFPHDSWWTSATISFSDGSQLTVGLEKTAKSQVFTFPARTVSWLTLGSLVKAEDPSPFPALTQIEVYGLDLAR